jgi:hypothetical protein
VNPARSGVKPVAIVAGYMARYPLAGMMLWNLHYVAGLQRLGYRVVFVEHFGWSHSCYDPIGNLMTDDPARGLSVMEQELRAIGLSEWCYVDARGEFHGLSRAELERLCRESALLLSIANTTWLEEFRECAVRIFLDGDPGFTQFRTHPTPSPSCAGYASPHDFQFHFSCGERIGQPDCPIPTHGLHWRPTRAPVVLALLPERFSPLATDFTTTMSWTAYGNVEYNGQLYGQKDIEMPKFLDLPKRLGPIFEIAFSGPETAAALLREHGWKIVSALETTRDLAGYLDYLGRSRGEFSVAKNGYVKTRCGMLYERTTKYLAMGKPAIVQDTGFSEQIPCGEGLFAVQKLDDALSAVETIAKDYARHCRAARRIAAEYFDANKVLGKLLLECGLPVGR